MNTVYLSGEPKYKWSHPSEWLSDKITELEGAGDAKGLASLLRSLTLDGDTIQEAFESDMDRDGYFREEGNDIRESIRDAYDEFRDEHPDVIEEFARFDVDGTENIVVGVRGQRWYPRQLGGEASYGEGWRFYDERV